MNQLERIKLGSEAYIIQIGTNRYQVYIAASDAIMKKYGILERLTVLWPEIKIIQHGDKDNLPMRTDVVIDKTTFLPYQKFTTRHRCHFHMGMHKGVTHLATSLKEINPTLKVYTLEGGAPTEIKIRGRLD